MALRLIAAPSVQPLTLSEVKEHCRVNHSYDDAILQLYLEAATAYADGPEGFLGRALVTQTWELVIDEFPENEIKIPLPPLQSVTSVTYDDAGGVEQVLATDQYTVDSASEPGWIVPVSPGSWPGTFEGINAVRIEFVAGYPPTSDSPPDLRGNIPDSIKAAILLSVGSFYEHRETVVVGQAATHLPWGAEQLLRRHRIQLGMA